MFRWLADLFRPRRRRRPMIVFVNVRRWNP
jgi:hypothetical protein